MAHSFCFQHRLSQYLLFISSRGRQKQETGKHSTEGWKILNNEGQHGNALLLHAQLYSSLHKRHIKYQIKKAHTAICVTDCCRFFCSSSGISKHSWKWTRSCFHNSLIYQNCFLLLWIPPHEAFQTLLEWPNNPHHNRGSNTTPKAHSSPSIHNQHTD